MSKLKNLEKSRGELEDFKTQRLSRYVLRVRVNSGLTLFMTCWAAAALFMGIFLLAAIISSGRYDYGLMLTCLVIFILSFLVFNQVCWRLWGREICLVTEDAITLIRKGTLFKRRRIISWLEYESLEADNDPETPRWIKMYSLGGGKIKVNYLGRSTRFGQNLDAVSAKQLVDEIRQTIARIGRFPIKSIK